MPTKERSTSPTGKTSTTSSALSGLSSAAGVAEAGSDVARRLSTQRPNMTIAHKVIMQIAVMSFTS
jgi:hypothetical protein